MNFLKFDRESRIFVKNSKWLLSSNVVNAVAAFFKAILIARGLGADLFGTYVIVTSFVMLVQEFFDLQIGSAIIKFGAEYKALQNTPALANLIHSSYFISLIMAIVSIAVVPLILQLWQQPFVTVPNLFPFIVFLAACSGVALLNRPCVAILQLHSRFMINAMVGTGIVILDLIVVSITLYFWSGSLITLLVAASLMNITQTVILNLSMCWELGDEIKFLSNFSISQIAAEIKKIWRFVVGTSSSNTLKKIIYRGDVLLLAALSTTSQVGFYAIAKKTASAIKIMTDPLALTIYPQLAKLIAERKFERVKKMIFKITGIIFFPFTFLILSLMFFGEKIISLAFGVEYLGAAKALLFVTAAIAVEAILFWCVSLLNSLGLVASRFAIYLASAVAGFVIAFSLTPAYGAIGMAFTLFVVNILVHGMFVGAAAMRIRKMREYKV